MQLMHDVSTMSFDKFQVDVLATKAQWVGSGMNSNFPVDVLSKSLQMLDCGLRERHQEAVDRLCI